MAGETQLQRLLVLMRPELLSAEYVFCSLARIGYGELAELNPLACFWEEEGLSLILEKTVADNAELEYESLFRRITLSVHSSLDAVGFTAAITTELAEHGISANVVAACFHDHLFVPVDKAEAAMQLLRQFEDLINKRGDQ